MQRLELYAPVTSPVAKPERAAPVLGPSPAQSENENLAKHSHKTPTQDELVVATGIGSGLIGTDAKG